MQKIASAVYRKRFVRFGISSWNCLLLYVFGRINRVGKNAFYGEKGLDLARYKLFTFYKVNHYQPNPNSKGMHRLNQAINKGNFSEFKIKRWEELLAFVFGKLERKRQNLNLKINDPDAILKLIRNVLVEFTITHGRLPRTRDKGMGSIIYKIKKGHLKRFGINKWNDLLSKVFGEVNLIQNVYISKQGLQRAISELKEFYKKNKRLPTTYDKGMGGILRAIKRGEWQNWGIIKWNDILDRTFGQVNIHRKNDLRGIEK